MNDRIPDIWRSLRVSSYLLIVILLSAGALTVFAAPRIDGTASVWSYARDDSVDHVQVVPMISWTMRDCVHPDLHFEGSLRGYTDVRGEKMEDRTLRLLRAVWIWEPQRKPYEVRLGQQWITEGVGRGNVTGGFLKYKLCPKTSATGYFGIRLDQALSLQDKNDLQKTAGGFNVRTRFKGVSAGVSYFGVAESWRLLYSAAGADAMTHIGNDVMVRGRLEMNIQQSAIERGQLIAQWQTLKNLTLSGEFRTQTPRIYDDSYFKLFLDEAQTTYARIGARWGFYKMLYLFAGGSTLFSDYPDPLYKVRAAVGCQRIEVGYTHWLSVAKGTMDGVYAQARFKFGEKYDVFGGYDFAQGTNTDLRDATSSYTAWLGATATPVHAFSVTLKAEQVSDQERKNDWRGLLGLTARFSNLR